MQTNSSFERRCAIRRQNGSGTSSCASIPTTRASCCCCHAGRALRILDMELGGVVCASSDTFVSWVHANDVACSWPDFGIVCCSGVAAAPWLTSASYIKSSLRLAGSFREPHLPSVQRRADLLLYCTCGRACGSACPRCAVTAGPSALR
jgi:hypothetical protein